MVPSIPFNQVIRTFAGSRPTPSTHDFIIGFAKNDNHFINLSGIESPGLVSSPAIAEYVVNEFVSKVLDLKANPNFNPYVKKRPNLVKMSVKERNEFIKKNPEYGEIICNCEKISKGEILFEMNTSVPPKTIKAVKKRTRAGFGKCQGGFCQPLVCKIISEKFDIPLNKVLFQKEGSFVMPYKTKEETK
jgi:glycerol-3-phosphate dehydrogenase